MGCSDTSGVNGTGVGLSADDMVDVNVTSHETSKIVAKSNAAY
jgi:hypothetical protein